LREFRPFVLRTKSEKPWIPAFAGMTSKENESPHEPPCKDLSSLFFRSGQIFVL
jgi:hypothetical protein